MNFVFMMKKRVCVDNTDEKYCTFEAKSFSFLLTKATESHVRKAYS